MATHDVEPTGICGIGASAGGLEPLADFLAGFPTDSGLVLVIAQHLSPDHESMMPQLLGRRTSMTVCHAEDGERLLPNHVYVLGPGDVVTVDGLRLVVHDRPSSADHTPTRQIDSLFDSLVSWGEKAATVVLSGTGNDGSEGSKAVRKAGGLALAQDETALFPDMPSAAVESGFIDAVGPPAQLALWTADYLKTGDRPPGATRFGPVETRILGDLEAVTGINFEDFKQGTVLRRLEHRMQAVGTTSLEQLADRVSASREEAIALSQDLLVGVTQFFRDPTMWQKLGEECLEELVHDAVKAKRPLRCWIAGSATGQEPYSLAMLLSEVKDRIDPTLVVKIFATDVHDRALSIARDGLYDDEELAGVNPERRERFFQVEDGKWRVIPEVRAMVAFSNHNLLVDAPFTRIDLMMCRNTLIYFTQGAQLNAFWAFGFALRRQGLLVLGDAEALGPASVDFSEMMDDHRVFRKIDDRVTAELKRARHAYNGHLATPSARRFPGAMAVPSPGRFGQRVQTDRVALAAHGVIFANEQLGGLVFSPGRELLHVIGGATNWLRFPAGATPPDAVRLIEDPALRLGVETVLRRLSSEEGDHVEHDLTISLASNHQRVRLRGVIVNEGPSPYFVVYTTSANDANDAAGSVTLTDGEAQTTIEELQIELSAARSQLHLALAQQDASTSDLAASNEELMVANEELQTSMEELSSVNEELRTVADESEQQLNELLELGADLEQILDATEIAVVLLDTELHIRRFSAPARQYFNLLSTDIGRPFKHLRASVPIVNLEPAIELAARTGETTAIRSDVQLEGPEDRTILTTIAPYSIARGETGVSIRVVDISPAWETERELRVASERLASSLDATGVVAFERELETGRRWVSDNFGEVLAVPLDEWMVGAPINDAVSSEDRLVIEAFATRLRSDAARDKPYPTHETTVRLVGPDGNEADFALKCAAGRFDGRALIRGVALDVTETHERENRLEDLNNKLLEFVRVASHDLRSPLRGMRHAIAMAERGGKSLDIVQLQAKLVRMHDLLDDLLAYARSEEHRGMSREIEPAGMIQSIFDLLDIPDAVRTEVSSDVERIHVEAIPLATTVRNLIDQAVRRHGPPEATNVDSGLVSVTVVEEGGFLQIVVEDDGDPGRLGSKATDPFRQLYKDGFGIGLETIHHLLGERGGYIDVQQSEGGTTVQLNWPITIDLDAKQADPSTVI